MRGHADQARELCAEMLGIAEASGNPAGLTTALGFAANLARDCGDVDRALDLTRRSIAFATEQKLHFWLGPALCTQGWAAVRQGRIDEGIGQIEQGLAIYEMIGVRGTYAYHRSGLIEAHLARRDPATGLRLLQDTRERGAALLDCFYDAELRRLEGELLRVHGDEPAAEAAFSDAVAIARRQDAQSLALRAATSLARLLRDRGERVKARAVLEPVHAWFTEGHDTHDLGVAAALLAEIS
jgi:adenylate cyclase